MLTLPNESNNNMLFLVKAKNWRPQYGILAIFVYIYIILGKLVNRPSSAKPISATFNAMDLILVSLERPKSFLCYFLLKNYHP